jgi:hypothetical protein
VLVVVMWGISRISGWKKKKIEDSFAKLNTTRCLTVDPVLATSSNTPPYKHE